MVQDKPRIYQAFAPLAHVADVGPLEDDHAGKPGFYVAAQRPGDQATANSSATLSVSTDSGATIERAGMALPVATMGAITGAASATASPVGYDTASVLTVMLFNPDHTLTSVTDARIDAGANMAIMGQEVIQFKTATAVSAASGLYRLTNLVRGLRGTEDRIADAISSTTFLLYTKSTVRFISRPLAEVGAPRRLYFTSSGGTISDGHRSTVRADITPEFRTVAPFAPGNLAGARDTSNNLTITWDRRTRHRVRLLGWSARPYGEDREAYEVDIMSGSTVLRTIEVAAESASYSAAQQTTDSLTPGDPVKVRVYQLSFSIGRGVKAEATI